MELFMNKLLKQKQAQISVSMMCADFLNLKKQLKIFEKYNIDFLHFDIMDGNFVDNIMLNNVIIQQIRKVIDIPFDIHLMIDNPLYKLDWFSFTKNDIVTVHLESQVNIKDVFEKIRSKGAFVGLAIKPSTPVKSIEPYLNHIDMVLVMTVNPGYAGQIIVDNAYNKIIETRTLLNMEGFSSMPIQVDGNVSFIHAKKMRLLGADIFVAGTSSVFDKNMDIGLAISKLKKALNISYYNKSEVI